jgi:uncharacterized protein (DUF302 family)
MRHIAFAILLGLGLAAPVAAQSDGLVVKESVHSVKDTIDRVVAALEPRGIKPALRVDHAAGAKSAGLDMAPAEVLVFGNPKLGTPLMQANPRIALELPMRVVAWQDAAGKVFLAYTAPEALKARYGVTGRDEVFGTMAGVLEAVTASAAAR